MDSKIVNFIKDLIGPNYYKLFPKPFGVGYERYKVNLIKKKINDKKIYPITYLDERIIEIPWIIKKLSNLKGKLLDAGSTLNHEYILKKINKNFKIYIQTLFPEKNNFKNLGVNYIYGDLAKNNFKKNFFDVITCISTLEHVGFDNSLYRSKGKKDIDKNIKNKHIKVFKNLIKILKPNGHLFITVPFGKKANYLNLQQFDQKKLNKMFEESKFKKIFIEYYIFKYKEWKKVRMEECKKIEPIVINKSKSRIVLSSNSVALIKIIK